MADLSKKSRIFIFVYVINIDEKEVGSFVLNDAVALGHSMQTDDGSEQNIRATAQWPIFHHCKSDQEIDEKCIQNRKWQAVQCLFE